MQELIDRIDCLEGAQAAMQAVIAIVLKQASPDDAQALKASLEPLLSGLLNSRASDRKIQAFQETMDMYVALLSDLGKMPSKQV